MYSRLQSPPTQKLWQDLAVVASPGVGELENIKTHLDVILLALEALSGIGSDAILQVAEELQLNETIGDRLQLWRLRQSNPRRKSSGGRKKLDVEEARALVLIICRLAQQQQELIRRAVSLLEQMTAQNQEPHRSALLGDYLDHFNNLYEERMEDEDSPSPKDLNYLAYKLLIDLLFYGSPNGHCRLWLALLQ